MRWIVGVDVGRRSRGALHFSRWLAGAKGVRWRDAFIPVHVLDQEHLRTVLRYHHLDEEVEAARAAIAKQLREVLPGEEAAPEIVQAITVEEGLEQARIRHGASGVIVARIAPRNSHRVYRLGSVARHLLSRLASPVVVVPPDLTESSVGDGPIVAASSLAADSVEACRLARSLADAAQRDLTIVHVVHQHAASARREAPELPDVEPGSIEPSERALANWVAQHAVWPELTAVIDGEFPTAAVAFAEARRAPLVAVGAHPSEGMRGAIEPKLWRWLAAHARQPILVVPAAAAALGSRPDASRIEDEAVTPRGFGP